MRVTAIAAMFCAASAAAQSGRVAGRVVVAGDSSRSLDGAEVTLLPTLRSVRTDTAGRFRFDGVDRGLYTLRVRRVGFEVSTEGIAVRDRPVDTLSIALNAAPGVLKEVVISGRRTLFPARYADAYDRVKHGLGDYWTREQIDSLNPYDVKTLLSTLPGVTADDRKVDFRRCSVGSAIGGALPIQVYVDGVRVTNHNAGPGMRDAYGVLEALRQVPISSVQLVEVYRGVSRIPAEFLDDACGVIAIWTR